MLLLLSVTWMLLNARDWFCIASIVPGDMYVEDMTDILTLASGDGMNWSSIEPSIAGKLERKSEVGLRKDRGDELSLTKALRCGSEENGNLLILHRIESWKT